MQSVPWVSNRHGSTTSSTSVRRKWSEELALQNHFERRLVPALALCLLILVCSDEANLAPVFQLQGEFGLVRAYLDLAARGHVEELLPHQLLRAQVRISRRE